MRRPAGQAEQPGSQPRTWTINGDFLALGQTGIARYAREVTLALDALLVEGHPLAENLALNLLAPRPADALALRRIPVQIVPSGERLVQLQWWVQAQLPSRVTGGLLSFCNLAPLAQRRQIVCIHNMHPWIMPGNYGWTWRLFLRAMLPLLGRRAQIVTTVSESSYQNLVEFGIAQQSKIVVTYKGSEHVRAWRPNRSAIDFNSVRPFVFCLGRNQSYKNVELVWRIANQLDELGIDVVVAGDINEQTIRSFGPLRPGNIRLVGRIRDDDVANALSRALCFLLPSRIEAFGLPAVEAMALGCPVIASSAPCLPEVCADAAMFADPDDTVAWVAAIRLLREVPELHRHMVGSGHARARAFSWRNIAETYLALMLRVDRETMAHARP